MTRKSFETALWLEKGGFIAAAAITVTCLVFALLCLFFLEPPESIAGTVVFALGSATPIVLGFLGNHGAVKRGDAKRSTEESRDA
ncbi:hypothetical protein ACFORJ_03805 [Corynebacterium hansenii]|uniref:Uncharacterized protein n=1 Tax=Corynebacterium hansenii TaxID=394964 RepID=A0ABV7ZM04_9CORY|nr:hypothetical protein [Corynebacterium hansenii]